MTLLEAALSYAQRGWLVFPCHSVRNGRCSCGDDECSSPGKHPRTPHGLRDGTTSPVQIRKWWGRWGDANIGICTGPESGLVVLDVDVPGGYESFGKLQQRYGPIPITATVRTGSGGLHVYCVHPGGKVESHKIAPGIDCKGDGGYVLAPPSNHLKGVYVWLTPPLP